MKGRRLLLVLAAMSAVACGGQIVQAIERFRRPLPAWMVHADRWYDRALGSAVNAVIAGACVAYLYRTRSRAGPDAVAAPTPWRRRVELRTTLYCIAAALALQLPLGVVRTAQAMNDPNLPWKETFWSLFPQDVFVALAFAAAILGHDRWRTRRDAQEDAGHCRACGYDLRATTDKCPECGTIAAAEPAP